MRLARAAHDNQILLVRLESDHAVALATESDHPAADALREALAAGVDLTGPGQRLKLSALTLLAPVARPSKVIAVGLNYVAHAQESGFIPPPTPVCFPKLPNSVTGPQTDVTVRAAVGAELDYEAELAVVVGAPLRDAGPERALAAVLGYTAANDLSARDAQFADGQWMRGKSFDGLCPLGPVIVTPDEFGDPQDARLVCRLNGEVMQDDSTKRMIFSVGQILSFLSRDITLLPGDVVLTGTPEGVGFSRTPPLYLRDGDVVEVEIERIGTLRNTIRIGGQA